MSNVIDLNGYIVDEPEYFDVALSISDDGEHLQVWQSDLIDREEAIRILGAAISALCDA